MRVLTFLPIIFILSACAGPQQPVVDLTGVDMGRYSQDQAACDRERYTGQNGFIEAGNPLTNCMERKGYKILVRN
ncbi:hypothetical protein [Methylorubrum extorquens]